jgi:drug/metabolite transporter (DMT)-like permease
VKPTRIATLVSLLVVVAAVTWGLLKVMSDHGHTLPPLTWTAPTGVAGLAVVVLVTWLGLRTRLRTPGQRPHPLSMARMAVLGKASAHVGPIVGGLYGGYLVVLLPDLEFDALRQRAILCATALAFSVALTVAGLLLERSCRVPPAASEDEVPAARA